MHRLIHSLKDVESVIEQKFLFRCPAYSDCRHKFSGLFQQAFSVSLTLGMHFWLFFRRESTIVSNRHINYGSAFLCFVLCLLALRR